MCFFMSVVMINSGNNSLIFNSSKFCIGRKLNLVDAIKWSKLIILNSFQKQKQKKIKEKQGFLSKTKIRQNRFNLFRVTQKLITIRNKNFHIKFI